MLGKKYEKTYEVSKEGRITIYPSLYGTKEEGNLKRILKRLLHIKKGRCRSDTIYPERKVLK
jgi:hypothetical protein